MKKSSTTILVFSALISLAIGGGVGFFIGSKTLEPKALDQSIQPQAANAKASSSELPFARASRIRGNYSDDVSASEHGGIVRPKTECIIHNLDSLYNYLGKLKQVVGNPSRYTPFKPGISLYLAKTPLYNYLQIKGKDTSYWLANTYSVFMMPVLYAETAEQKFFAQVMINNKEERSGNYSVNLLKAYKSPFGDVLLRGAPYVISNDKQIIINQFMKNIKDFVDDDKDGFDLGHTSP